MKTSCGHSACRQNYIDTGTRACIQSPCTPGCLGLLLNLESDRIERCDECARYASDEAAAFAVFAFKPHRLGYFARTRYALKVDNFRRAAKRTLRARHKVCVSCQEDFTKTGPGAQSLTAPTLCTYCACGA